MANYTHEQLQAAECELRLKPSLVHELAAIVRDTANEARSEYAWQQIDADLRQMLAHAYAASPPLRVLILREAKAHFEKKIEEKRKAEQAAAQQRQQMAYEARYEPRGKQGIRSDFVLTATTALRNELKALEHQIPCLLERFGYKLATEADIREHIGEVANALRGALDKCAEAQKASLAREAAQSNKKVA